MLVRLGEHLRRLLRQTAAEPMDMMSETVTAPEGVAHRETNPEPETRAPQRFLIVGLGNPGREHKKNRHNIGFMAIDQLAETWGISLGKVQQRAITGQGRVGEDTIILAKPQTYMNSSGDAVGPLARYFKVPTENVLVIYDEIDIPFGALRIRSKGGSGGHNGMKSIINHLGQDFPRIRIGVGRPQGKMPPAAYVLQDFKGAEWDIVTELLAGTVAAVNTFIREGIDLSMSRHNRG